MMTCLQAADEANLRTHVIIKQKCSRAYVDCAPRKGPFDCPGANLEKMERPEPSLDSRRCQMPANSQFAICYFVIGPKKRFSGLEP
jgi:hypothetical protein